MISSVIRKAVARRALLLAGLVALATPHAHSAEPEDARLSLARGAYLEAVQAATSGWKAEPENLEWPLVLAQALQRIGKAIEARDLLTEAVKQRPFDIRLRLAIFEACKTTGSEVDASTHLAELERLVTTRSWAYRTPPDRIAVGRVVLLLGADPKRVLEEFYDPVRKARPELRESYVASGELALEKNDFELAAKSFTAAARKFPEDADIQFGLARAYASSDAQATEEAIKRTLALNPNHLEAHLLLADHHIDAEDYAAAGKELDEVLKLNPAHPDAHAYRAVLAHLRADEAGQKKERAEAQKQWPKNPEVPHLIGRKLSQKYRFAEGAALQREALALDGDFVAAKAQLANDLLRLGKDEEGWKLAEEVQTADPYDVAAYNLTTLREATAHFRTLSNERFQVRMDPLEADIYGAEVLALLDRAHATLTKKYGLTLKARTIVEIFPEQKDFAIRTFGMPGGAGYLGVCFGGVITANSPASRPGSPANWQAILWHEFTHVVTLTLTKNKMPRWLSEGISVFEERQASGTWGERMKPRYRAMILGEDLTPVSQLSAAFLQPKTPLHLGLAYYESSLVVEWLTQRWGLEKMKALLGDLARGAEINSALAAHFEPIEKLDADFAGHARAIAKATGPGLDWSEPKPIDLASPKAGETFIELHPDNFTALNQKIGRLMTQKKWAEAREPINRLIELYPDQRGSGSAYWQLARVERELGEPDAEMATLTRLSELAAEALDAYERLMELAAERQDWAKVLEYSSRFLAVDPLKGAPHRFEGEACEALGKKAQAIAAYRALLRLEPPDPPEIHFRLARLLRESGEPAQAKRQVLMALEEAPRFRAAHELLLKFEESTAKPAPIR